MTYIKDKQLLFFHLPKCGGSSVNYQVCKSRECEYFDKHYNVKQYKNMMGIDKYNESTKFALCRHPLDVLISAYMFKTIHYQKIILCKQIFNRSFIDIHQEIATAIQNLATVTFKLNIDFKVRMFTEFRNDIKKLIRDNEIPKLLSSDDWDANVFLPTMGQRSILQEDSDIDIIKLEESEKLKEKYGIDISTKINSTLGSTKDNWLEWYGSEELIQECLEAYKEDIQFLGY